MKKLIIAITISLILIVSSIAEAKKLTLTTPEIKTSTEIRLTDLHLDYKAKRVVIGFDIGYDSSGTFVVTRNEVIIKDSSEFQAYVDGIKNNLEDKILNDIKVKHAGTVE